MGGRGSWEGTRLLAGLRLLFACMAFTRFTRLVGGTALVRLVQMVFVVKCMRGMMVVATCICIDPGHYNATE